MPDSERISALKEIVKISGKHCQEIIPIVKSILAREYEDDYNLKKRNRERPALLKGFFEEDYTNYCKLLNSGMFFEFHPNLTGNWESDCEWWINNSNNK